MSDWSFLSWWGRYVVLGLFSVALIVSGVRVWGRPVWTRPEGWTWASIAVSALILLSRGRRIITLSWFDYEKTSFYHKMVPSGVHTLVGRTDCRQLP